MVILHIGLGSFLQTVQAPLMQTLRQQGAADARLLVASFKNEDENFELLAAQQGRYVLATSGATSSSNAREAVQCELIESIDECIDTSLSLFSLAEHMNDPTLAVLAVSIGGTNWFLDAQGRLNLDADDVASDLRNGGTSSIYGWLVTLLQARMDANVGPLTVMNCDDFPFNGSLLRQALQRFLAAGGRGALSQWIDQHVRFPNSVAERLSGQGDAAWQQRLHNTYPQVQDLAVCCETSVRWSVEDDFPAGRPDWPAAGVQLVDALGLCEQVTLRMVNVVRAMTGWVGMLTDCRYVHEAARHPWLRETLQVFARKTMASAPSAAVARALASSEALIDRCGNPHLQIPVEEACTDGFVTARRYFAPAVGHALLMGQDLQDVAMLPAVLFLFLEERMNSNVMVPYEDDGMDPIEVAQLFNSRDPIAGFCSLVSVWGSVAGNPALVACMREAVEKARAGLLEASAFA